MFYLTTRFSIASELKTMELLFHLKVLTSKQEIILWKASNFNFFPINYNLRASESGDVTQNMLMNIMGALLDTEAIKWNSIIPQEMHKMF